MSFFLAIDAGGTKTQCLLADETRVLGRASTGTIKLMRVSQGEATTRLQEMLDEVASASAVSLADITRTCIGLAGLTIPAVRAWATAAITAKVGGDLILVGDEEIALDAAFTGGPGILVIAGTGSNVLGRARDGRLHRAGGWGPILGDEGGGYWIGLEAIRAALREYDRADDPHTARHLLDAHSSGGPELPTAPPIPASSGTMADTSYAGLLEAIRRHSSLGSLPELVALANHRGDANQGAPDFAALARVVAGCADEGNLLAAKILRQAGEALADVVTVVAHKMPASGEQVLALDQSLSHAAGWENTPRAEGTTYNSAIAYTGSVLTHISLVRDAMVARLALTIPAAHVQSSAVDPLEGALYRARKA